MSANGIVVLSAALSWNLGIGLETLFPLALPSIVSSTLPVPSNHLSDPPLFCICATTLIQVYIFSCLAYWSLSFLAQSVLHTATRIASLSCKSNQVTWILKTFLSLSTACSRKIIIWPLLQAHLASAPHIAPSTPQILTISVALMPCFFWSQGLAELLTFWTTLFSLSSLGCLCNSHSSTRYKVSSSQKPYLISHTASNPPVLHS